METSILLVDCTDEKGLIHKITGLLNNAGLNLININEFEIAALSKASRLVFEERVFLSNNKTIIFE